MTRTRHAVPPTGGQWNFAGVLYQLLVTLRTGLHAVIAEVASGEDAASVRLIVEPDCGGDAQTLTQGLRRVDQIKIRRGAKPWTTQSLIEGVLPDLFKALSPCAPTTRFRFVTDNLNGTEKLAEFFADCQSLDREGQDHEALDALTKSYRWGQARVTAATLFAHAVATIAPGNLQAVWRFLCEVEIVGMSEAEANAEVEVILRDMVDDPQQVSIRRNALVQALLDLGAARSTIDGAALLRSVGLEPDRLSHPARLPGLLREALARELVRQHYDRRNDVRPEPSLPDAGLILLSGDSGQGKTWRMCQAALGMAEGGQAVVFLPATGTLADIERELLDRIWPAHLGPHPRLARAAALVSPKLGRGGFWLTLCLDDLTDPALARSLLRSEWDALGIRILITGQDRIAGLLRSLSDGISVQTVPDFTMSELRERLRRAGRDPALIPDDVLESLSRPIMAELYCRIPGTENWTGVTEYALMDHYWRWATREHRDQSLHLSDASAVLALVGALLDGQTPYPWPPSQVRRLNIPPETPPRLIATGLLAETEDGAIALSHSRLLNWAAAEEMARRLLEGEGDVAGLAARLDALDDLRTPAGEPVGRVLTYAMFDLYWMLCRRTAPGRVGELSIRHLQAPVSRADARHFFTEGLANLGTPVIPVLDWLSRRGDADEAQRWRMEIAAAFAALGPDAEDEVARVALELVTDDVGDSRTIGLKVLKTIPAPFALDQLWAIHRERRAALARADARGGDGDWHGAYSRSNASYAALQRATRARPDWIVDVAPSVDIRADADQLIWLIHGLDWSTAQAVWRRCKAPLLALYAAGDHGAARIIRRLGDREELPRILAGLEETGVDCVCWFDALARLDPDQALTALASIDPDELASTGHWWMPGLALRTRNRFGDAIRHALGGRPRDDDPILMELGLLYQNKTDLLDPDTLDLLIDNYQTCLEADAAGTTSGRITRRHVRGLLASIKEPALLERLAARAGSRFEALLTKCAIANPGRVSMTVDRDGTDYHRILAAIGGAGYDALVSAELDRPNVHGRTDGVTAAQWTRDPEVLRKLEALALDPDDDTYRQIQLMQTLATHRVDRGLAAMVRQGSPVFLNAIDVRDGGPPIGAEILEEIRALLDHSDPAERRIGLNLCGFLDRDTGGRLMAPLLIDRQATDEEAGLIVSIFTQTEYYEPDFLGLIRTRLDRSDTGLSAARYLAGHGDADARAAVVDWLDTHPLTQMNASEPPIAFHLLQFEDSRPGALRFLSRLAASSLGRSHEGEVLSVLAENGDAEARRRLETLANRSPRNGTGAIIPAIRALSQELPREGQAAAERLFRRSNDLGAAAILLRQVPEEGLNLLLPAYPAATVANQWGMGRVLRSATARETILERLRTMADSQDSADRRTAADLAGWMPFEEPIIWLDYLVSDPDPDVENAALVALRRRSADANAAELIEALPRQPRSRQWAWLCALIELSDPSHLTTIGDPRSIHDLLATLGEDFGQEAERLIERRRRYLKAASDQAQRERDR